MKQATESSVAFLYEISILSPLFYCTMELFYTFNYLIREEKFRWLLFLHWRGNMG